MTLETLLILRQSMSATTLNVGADDFTDWAEKFIVAKKELDEAIRQAEKQKA